MKDWQTATLQSLCEFFADGDWIESKDQAPKGIRLIQTGNVGVGVFKDRGEKARYISEQTYKQLRCTDVLAGDCLISRLPDPVGRSCILPDVRERMITAVDCTIVRFNPGKLMPEFFNYYSQSTQYLRDVEAQTSGTTRKRISRTKLGAILIPVPPFAEQQRIVAILDEAFAAIATAKANTEKNLANARAVFDSYLHSVFAQGGEEWITTTLDKLATNLDSRRVPITKDDRKAGDIPYYGASGIVDHVADYIFDEDILLISEDGANLLARSTPIAFSVSGKCWVNNHAHVLKFNNLATQRYVEFYIASIKIDEFVTGTAQPKLNQKAMNTIPIPIPTAVSEQSRIVFAIESLSVETRRLESLAQQKLAALDALKASLLHHAFTGQLTDSSRHREAANA